MIFWDRLYNLYIHVEFIQIYVYKARYISIYAYIHIYVARYKKERQDLENISKRVKSLTWSKCKDISENICAIHRC